MRDKGSIKKILNIYQSGAQKLTEHFRIINAGFMSGVAEFLDGAKVCRPQKLSSKVHSDAMMQLRLADRWKW